MARTSTIDEYSCSSLMIEMRFGETLLASATAFQFKFEDQLFLVTNWHNVSGKNPQTGELLSSDAAQPDNLTVFLHVDGKLGLWIRHKLDIIDDDQRPMWYEHPVHRSNVDVVALPMNSPTGTISRPINMMAHKKDMRVSVGDDAFVLGFPFGLTLAGAFPVWKRASIATEPEIDLDNLPKFMVDTSSRPGMSGSPAIRRQHGPYQNEDGDIVVVPGAATRFMGVYSGRIGADDELRAQLGVVWKAAVIEEIVAGRVRGSRR